jgi:glucan phosphoethanolaminetransferase (alkaline phosphatase superfamily)
MANYELLLIAGAFLFVLTVWEAWRFKISYRGYFARTREREGGSLASGVAKILAAFLFAFLFIAFSLGAGPYLKAVYLFIFFLAVSLEHGYAVALGQFTNVTDALGVIHVDGGTRRDAIWSYLDVKLLLPSVTYALLLFLVPFRMQYDLALFAVTLAYGAVLFTLLGLYSRDEDFPAPGLSAFFRTAFFYLTRKEPRPRQTVSLSARNVDLNIIFVVDESIRSDHLSVNGYSRETTPYLDALRDQGKLITWGDALAGETLSFLSNNALLTGVYPAGDPRTETAPSIFQYAKARGYKTHYFDAWGPAFWLGRPEDLGSIDLHKHNGHYPKTPSYDLDEAIAREVHSIVAATQGNFIWINKHGAHLGYQRCYPPDRAVWKPEWRNGDGLSHMEDLAKRERLVNSYDNALHYNLEAFFSELLGPSESILGNTYILYTSDHAETLSDHGETWGHGRGTPNERLVPAILFAEPGRISALQPPASHSNLFATLLALMQIPPSEWVLPYDRPLIALPELEPAGQPDP